MAEEHVARVFSIPAGTFYVDLLNDDLWRAYDDVVLHIRLVVPEIAQMDRVEEKSARRRPGGKMRSSAMRIIAGVEVNAEAADVRSAAPRPPTFEPAFHRKPAPQNVKVSVLQRRREKAILALWLSWRAALHMHYLRQHGRSARFSWVLFGVNPCV